MRKDLKIGLLVGMILVIGIVMLVSLWPGQGVEERRQKMFQEVDIHSPIEIDRSDGETPVEKSEVIEKVPDPPVKKQVRIHTVSNGETLSSIAIEYYGSTRNIQKIIDANRNLAKNPDKIRVGMQLVIPSP